MLPSLVPSIQTSDPAFGRFDLDFVGAGAQRGGERREGGEPVQRAGGGAGAVADADEVVGRVGGVLVRVERDREARGAREAEPAALFAEGRRRRLGRVGDHEREAVGAGAAADRDREFVGEVARVDLGRPERAAGLVGGGCREHEVRAFEFGGAVELPAAGAGVGDHRDAFFFGRRVGVREGDGVGARGEREGGHGDLAAGGGDFGCGGAVDRDGGLPAGAGGCGLSDRAARALDRARERGRRGAAVAERGGREGWTGRCRCR